MLRHFKSRVKGRLQQQSYYKALQLFQYLDKQSLATLENYQWQTLLAVLSHARNKSPFYEKRIPRKLGSWNDFRANVPILKRFDLQGSLDGIRASELPKGVEPLGSIFSSGSTGTPVEVLQTNVSQAWFKACHLRDLAWAGWDLQKSAAAIKYIPSQQPQKPEDLIQTRSKHWDSWINHVFVTGKSSLLSIDTDPEQQYEWLKTIRPGYLITYPSNLEALLDVMDSKGSLGIESVKTLSEPLSLELRSRAQEYFSIRDTYSSQELGYIASECEHGGMHLHAENNVVEILRDDGRPCDLGESGRVVVTNLVNTATPLIRYELGDRASIGEPCECGRIHPTLKSVDGKIHPLFVLPNGVKKNSLAIAISLRKIGGMKHFQVVQHDLGVTVNIVKSPEWRNDTESEITRMLFQFFGSPISIEVNEVRRMPLHAGKARHLVCDRSDFVS